MCSLTPRQKEIIKNLKDEFKEINVKKEVVNKSVIDLLFDKANEYSTERDEFYNEIENNNSLILLEKRELIEACYKKLCVLFKNYPDLVITHEDNALYFGYIYNDDRTKPNYKRGYCYISGARFIRNHNARFNSNEKAVTEYSHCGLRMDNVDIHLEDFELTSTFQDKVLTMFTEK